VTSAELRPLPTEAIVLLEKVAAPARLVARLRVAHDVAADLCDWVHTSFPAVRFDREAVLFGAAIHDIGKALYPEELSAPGTCHEQAGYDLLTAHGVSPRLARFTRGHTAWDAADPDELLVGVADRIRKGTRVDALEHALIGVLAASSGRAHWEVFQALDDFAGTIDAAGDRP